MARKVRTVEPTVANAAYNLRVSGMSERAIYENFRDTLKENVPSYRDLRAVYKERQVYYRRDAAEARRLGLYENTEDQRAIHRTFYTERLETTRRVDKTPNAKDALDRNYVLGMMARAGVEPDTLEDAALAESLEKIYDGLGS
jgi:hypothetical protein